LTKDWETIAKRFAPVFQLHLKKYHSFPAHGWQLPEADAIAQKVDRLDKKYYNLADGRQSPEVGR